MLAKIINGIKKRSLMEIVIFIIRMPVYFYDKYTEKRFDNYYGTDTNLILSLEEYKTDGPNIKDAGWYESITKNYFIKMIKQVPAQFSDFVFIDLGSGKGRSLMLAADYPFKQIIGVEFSSQLHQIAEKNMVLFEQKKRVSGQFQLHCMDAVLFDFPTEHIVLFLYNPFQGKVMQSVVKKIEAFISASKKTIFILYRNPKCADMFEKSKMLAIYRETDEYKIYSGVYN